MIPYVPGDHDHPEWWSPTDDAILQGELNKLAELPGSPYVEREHERMVYHRIETRRRRCPVRGGKPIWTFLAYVVIVGLFVLTVLIASWAGEQPSPIPAGSSAPATYGPPGPNGGPL